MGIAIRGEPVGDYGKVGIDHGIHLLGQFTNRATFGSIPHSDIHQCVLAWEPSQAAHARRERFLDALIIAAWRNVERTVQSGRFTVKLRKE